MVVQNGNVLLTRQYRLIINDLSYEIPGGNIEKGESSEAAAMRECLEETGIQCFNLRQLIRYHLSLDISKNYTHVFCTEQSRRAENSDSANYVWIPLADCIRMVVEGRIQDSLSIIALLVYHNSIPVEKSQ